MTKEIPNLQQSSKNSKISKKTLKHLKEEVFFKIELSEAQKVTDEAFTMLVRSEACEDTSYRNSVMDAFTAIAKLLVVIKKKKHPKKIHSIPNTSIL